MKGYILPPVKLDKTLVTKSTLVGCKNCQNIWREDRLRPKEELVEINGPRYDSDFCDRCLPKEYHACSTGDCDHEKQTECDEQLAKDYPQQNAEGE